MIEHDPSRRPMADKRGKSDRRATADTNYGGPERRQGDRRREPRP